MIRGKRRPARARALTWVVCAALAVGASGCGHAPGGSAPDRRGSDPVASVPGTAPTVPLPASSGPDLVAVDEDGQVVDAAATQSDADFGAAVSAQAQDDQP